VLICTPSYTHAEIAVRCLEQGLHTLCEKPVAYTLADAQTMLEAAERRQCMLMIAQVVRFWPEYLYLKQAVDQNLYGQLKQLSCSRTGAAPLWGWDNWYLDPARSGFAPFDLHIHDLDFIYYLLGRPRQVQAFGISPGDPQLSTIHSRLVYGSGVLVEAVAGWYPGPVPFAATFRAVFEQGVLDYLGDRLLLYRKGASSPELIECRSSVRLPGVINLPDSGPYYTEDAYFFSCVRQGAFPSVITPQQTYEVLDVLLKAVESSQTGQTLTI
jgi:predicted dehydrogenase